MLKRHSIFRTTTTALAFTAILSAFAPGLSAKSPCIDQTSADSVTEDGLHRLRHTKLDSVYVSPTIDLAKYGAVFIDPLTIVQRQSRHTYDLDQRGLDLAKRYFYEAAVREVQKKGDFEIAEEPGPGTLWITPALVDVEVYVPTRDERMRMGARTKIIARTAGALTLLAELRDGETGELIARVADQKEVGDQLHKSTGIYEWAEVRRIFAGWGRLLRKRLSEARETTSPPPACE